MLFAMYKVKDFRQIILFVWILLILLLIAIFFVLGLGNNQPTPQQTGNNSDVQQRLAQWQQKVTQNPNDVDALIELGFAYYDSFRFNEAVANFEKAVSLAPNNAEAVAALGLGYESLNRPNDALQQYDRALALKADFDFPKVRKARLLAESKGDYAQGAQLLREVVDKMPIGVEKTKLKQKVAEYEQKAKTQK